MFFLSTAECLDNNDNSGACDKTITKRTLQLFNLFYHSSNKPQFIAEPFKAVVLFEMNQLAE